MGFVVRVQASENLQDRLQLVERTLAVLLDVSVPPEVQDGFSADAHLLRSFIRIGLLGLLDEPRNVMCHPATEGVVGLIEAKLLCQVLSELEEIFTS